MAEKEELLKEKLSNSGLFDFKGLYSYMHSWFFDEKYGVIEEKYNEKVASGGNSRDIAFAWKASKRLSDYFKIEIELLASINDLSDVEVEIDGKRKKMNKGKVDLEFKGILVRDPDSTWDERPFYAFLRDVYNKYVIPGRIQNMQIKVMQEIKKLKEEVKSFLELSGRR